MFKRKKSQFSSDNLPESSIIPQPLSEQTGINAKRNWFKTHKKLAIILGVILGLLLISGGVTAYFFLNHKPEEKVVQTIKKQEPAPAPKYYSNLTGSLVKSATESNQAVTGIMIENSPDARPQSGLKQSGVVFEAIAEGGITRFLALYQQEKPELIGPVRSVRMYYVDWVAAFDASIAHIGGSSAALAEVRNGHYRDIDQFFNSNYYWRASDRYAPHNVYTSFSKLDELNKNKGYTTSEFTGFTRKDTKPTETPTATSINVTISGPTYNSSYLYNKDTNSYDRSQAGAPHLDREEGQISPRVVIVLDVQQSTIFEDGYRESINAIGEGVAHIFQDGTVQEVTWKKPSRSQQITFTDASGNDVELARGQTWITAVPTNRSGGVTWQ